MKHLLLAIALAATPATPAEVQRTEAAMEKKLPNILPSWIEPRSPVRCIRHCKGITSSTFRLKAWHAKEHEDLNIEIVCDDVPDKHQCGWLVVR